MKIEMKINEISSKVLSKVESQFSYPSLNLKRIWKIIKRFERNFHNGLYGSLPGFAVKHFIWGGISQDILALYDAFQSDVAHVAFANALE